MYSYTIKSLRDRWLPLPVILLDFSKTAADKMHIEDTQFELHKEVEEVVALMEKRATEKGLEVANYLHPGVPEIAVGDPFCLRQVLTNLLSNAIKFTEEGSIVASVRLVSEDAGIVKVRFEVADTGTGISHAKQENLFEAFSQADASTTREYGGTGLGLTISRRLVELMGGEIGVESQPVEGSVFWFTVSLRKPAESSPPTTAWRSDLDGLRVLVVDDNPTNRRVLGEQIGSWRAHVESVEGGAEAFRTLRQAALNNEAFDVAILDLQTGLLGKLIEDQDAPSVRWGARFLRESAYSVDAMRLANLCGKLERTGSTEDLEGAHRLATATEAEYKLARTALLDEVRREEAVGRQTRHSEND